MIKEVVRPEEGFEAIYAELVAKRDALLEDKEIAKMEALEKVERDFAAREDKIAKVLETISVVEEVEELVEDETAEETVENDAEDIEENECDAEDIAEETSDVLGEEV